jgi:ATP-dependent phosphoenolpyruvate carboxykinase
MASGTTTQWGTRTGIREVFVDGFTDAVFRALVPAVAQLVNAKTRQTFDAGIYQMNTGRAGRLLRKTPQEQSWLPR